MKLKNMKKLCAIALFALIFISASARGRILMNEDFSWVPWGGNTTDCAWNVTGECRIDFWGPSAQNKGWTSKTTWVWTRHNFVKLGKGNYGGDFCSPALKALGKDETVTATLTFQAVRYQEGDGSNVNEKRILHVAILNAGTITGISGGSKSGNVDRIDNTYSLSAYPNITSAAYIELDPANLSGKRGDNPSACWENDLSKYTITIKDATDQTQILFVGGNYNTTPTNRVCLDNVKVVTTDDDPNDMSTIIEMAGDKYGYGKMFAYQNNDINNIHFDYTKNVDLELYEPEKVIQHDTVYVGSVPKSLSNVHGYVGPKITLPRETNSYAFDIVSYNCMGGQSSAAYGDYLFVVEDKLAAIHMYNLKKNEMVTTCKLTPHNETTDGTSSGGVLYHCNQSTFGTEKYSSGDDFPLLYITQRSRDYVTDNQGRCFVNVLRIVPTKNAAGEYTSFSVVEVQTIYLPVANTTNALSNANLTIDPQTGKFYTYSRTNNESAPNYKRCRITEFRHVSPTEGSVVYLNDSLDSYEILAIDSTDTYILPGNYVSAFDAQGAFIWDNKLYISQGIGNNTSQIYLRVVDLAQKQQINAINLYKDGFKFEPEGLFMHDDHIKVSTNGQALYTLYFE